jgi:pyruvate ferredoxin oxidoreductase gamma subunit
MYRIRLHGRGGQGIKTASRILGSALFAEGFEVQDAPRYGAERRGAPIFAYVRADREAITERGVIERPDLVIVADESLVQVPAAGVMAGLRESSVTVMASAESADVWRDRLQMSGRLLTLPPEPDDDPALMGSTCVGAATALLGRISRESLERATRSELEGLAPSVVERNFERALKGFESMQAHKGLVVEGAAPAYDESVSPAWVELDDEPTSMATPVIVGGSNTENVPTGLWRTTRPVVHLDHCHRCTWICSTLCPDGAIEVGSDHEPVIDLDHCKGCLLCVAVCPSHAIVAEAETQPVQLEKNP